MVNPPNGSLEPWWGYWFRAYANCELIIPPIPCPPAPPSSALSRNSLVGMELPPPPPEVPPILENALGSFDDLVPVRDTSAGVRVDIVPNPASEKAAFTVRGICWCHVAGLHVEIYDLSGRCVFARETEEPSLEWILGLPDGNILANGVYLVRAWVKVDGSWHGTGTRKLAVCR